MKNYKIAILAGDGIGPEITAEAVKVLKLIEERNDVRFELMPALFGACAYFATGDAFPQETKDICDSADAILKGPIGLSHEESKNIPIDKQPERGALLPMRRRYNTYANFRPVSLPKELAHFSPLKAEIIGEGIDIIIVRELVGGLYFGEKEMGVDENGQRYVKETLEYTEAQIRQIMHQAFKLASHRKKVLHNIHKSNVLKSSVLWNEIMEEVAKDYPEIKVINILVDAAATLLCLKPTQFDVMVMENMFGDILSDQGGGILGSLGLMPSACLGDEKSYYEPSHGSAPDIAGKNIANPYSMIGSVAMMLENSFDMADEAK
ncbi:MAG: 3-isopropylmalate dehydrogenase, partial [Methyloprofundus sp.]|nr:3-isopropylmalate dehydrogenase [Methyloprofundus sp.]